MARILDKLLPSKSQRLVALRQRYDWLVTERDALAERYEAKKREALDNFIASANKALERPAFLACDKQAYADAAFAEKLQRFDVGAYLSQRAANHGTAKAIFKAIGKGEDWQALLPSHTEKIARLAAKRERAVLKLNAEREAFLAKQQGSDAAPYEAAVAELTAAYEAKRQALDERYGALLAQKTEAYERRIAKLAAEIEALVAAMNNNRTLDEDVLLEVTGLKMYFGGLKAVDDLSFRVRRGEIFGLIGPNGAGKTTVFNCITRFYDATGGDMYYANKYGEVVDLREFKVHDVILQGISRTFQNIELVKEISVIENLLVASTRTYRSGFFTHALGLPLLSREEELLRKKAMKILKFIGIDAYANWLAFGLPYGILKKVELARALMADANLIIMDEPAAGLNDTETAELTQIIRRIRDEFGVTILLVEHDMGLVMNVCDTVCAISFGKMLAIGTPEEVKANKAVQVAYLGTDEEEEA